LQAIQANIAHAQQSAGRNDQICLLAVSKAQSADKVREAYLAGQRTFGENYLQEALNKQALLTDCAIEWHFIGPIQSNKTQLISQHFDWVHSVDRIKIAKRLSEARPAHFAPLNICLQVNSSAEASKSGVDIGSLASLAQEIVELPHLSLRGIMAIPAPSTDLSVQHAQFEMVAQAFKHLQQLGFKIDTLSIGMSDDYMAAIHEGATIVRIGSAIFGARNPPTSQE
jgi:pyridoxal phosphate enzyme (YggS family)